VSRRSAPFPVLRPILIALAATALIALPTPAQAHGIGGEAADLSVWGFIPLGMEHMLLDWDHLAFIAGVLLLARTFKLSLKLISVFVAGHSTTLVLATAAGWQVNAGVVDAIIAASVAFVGSVGLFRRPQRWGWFAAVIAGFGLIHGLGLATRFADLGLPAEGRLAKVIAFNVGIEVGQATAIFIMYVTGQLVAAIIMESRPSAQRVPAAEPGTGSPLASQAVSETRDNRTGDRAPRSRAALVFQLASAALFIGGSVTAALVALNAVILNPEPEPTRLAEDTTCAIEKHAEALPGPGGHPEQGFYAPNETAPINDFGHSLGDGYLVVLYSPGLVQGDVTSLEQYVDSPAGQGVLAGAVTPPVADRLPSGDLESDTVVKVLNLSEVMTCSDFEIDSIETFAHSWFTAQAG
jgi:hydrogenase/urease accessory protein HupE